MKIIKSKLFFLAALTCGAFAVFIGIYLIPFFTATAQQTSPSVKLTAPNTITPPAPVTIWWEVTGDDTPWCYVSSSPENEQWTSDQAGNGVITQKKGYKNILKLTTTTQFTITCGDQGKPFKDTVEVVVQPAGTVNSSCYNLDSTKPVPEGWGASYNVHSPRKEPLIRIQCSPDRPDFNKVTIGNESPGLYVYQKGYKLLGTTWTPITYNCFGQSVPGRQGINWCIGGATAPLSTADHSFAVYTCQKMGTEWKCGCRDAACRTTGPAALTGGFWQLQEVKR